MNIWLIVNIGYSVLWFILLIVLIVHVRRATDPYAAIFATQAVALATLILVATWLGWILMWFWSRLQWIG